MDVVTVGKLLQACAALYTDEYNPKPGLLAGTFTGSAVALRTGRRILELLDGGYWGPKGKSPGYRSISSGTWITWRRRLQGSHRRAPRVGRHDRVHAIQRDDG